MRVCYNCKYIHFDSGSPHYSSYTPGTNMSMYCKKDHWKLDEYSYVQDLANALDHANTCPDYEHSDKAKELQIEEQPPRQQPHCNKCGSELNSYYADGTTYTHCPVCAPVESVQTSDGTVIYPRIVK